MSGRVLRDGCYRIVELVADYDASYQWVTTEQVLASFSRDGVVLFRFNASLVDDPTARLVLSHGAMEALVEAYQTYRCDRETSSGEACDLLDDLGEHPF